MGDLGERGSQGVVGVQLTWDSTWDFYSQIGGYTFSLRNQLRENVRNIYCLVIFYDANNNPIDVDVVRYKDVIPAGLARRITSKVDGSVQKLTTLNSSSIPRTKVEFRIMDFEIVN